MDVQGKIIAVKYGGNAMTDESCKAAVIDDIMLLKNAGAKPVVIHGGGPFIGRLLDAAGVESEFIAGLRKTDEKAMTYVEMALKGEVGGELVRLLNNRGAKAVGIAGKDGAMVRAKKLTLNIEGADGPVDLGQVGEITSISTHLLDILLHEDYIPVIAPIGLGDDGKNYNINADTFAGSIAGALKADYYFVLTDVDGLMLDPSDPSSLIKDISMQEAVELGGSVIKGGMIPKMEACFTALRTGAKHARIVNGTKSEPISAGLLSDSFTGTTITG